MRFTAVINVPLVLLALIVGAAALPGLSRLNKDPMDLGLPHFSSHCLQYFLGFNLSMLAESDFGN
jgi:hypothetical protein